MPKSKSATRDRRSLSPLSLLSPTIIINAIFIPKEMYRAQVCTLTSACLLAIKLQATIGFITNYYPIQSRKNIGHQMKESIDRHKKIHINSNNMLSSLQLGYINDNDQQYNINLQSDTSLFGRGEMHLSAILNDGDVAMYQIGSWEVDGVIVGEEKPERKFCIVDTMQVVWTHNCEHGVIRGLSCNIEHVDDDIIVKVSDPIEFIEFGPEQLVAQLPVNWINNDKSIGNLLVKLPEHLMQC